MTNDHVDARDPSVLFERCFRNEDICLSVVIERVHSEGVHTQSIRAGQILANMSVEKRVFSAVNEVTYVE